MVFDSVASRPRSAMNWTLPRSRRLVVAGVVLAVAAGGCATRPHAAAAGGALTVVAAENFWGSLAAQLGGDRVRVSSIIDNPAVDPHDYEPTSADARLVSAARLVVLNGVGYDPWARKLVGAGGSGRTVLDVGELVGVQPGGNPHRWYAPGDVRAVIDRLTADYKAVDPAHAGDFDTWHATVLDRDLKGYFDAVARIRASYGDTPVGASESIVAPLADALGLRLVTPPSFLTAISEGTDPSAADKATIDAQIARHELRVYVYNSQNATPDVQGQVAAARAAGIPVTAVTETLTPAGATFQEWQVTQLAALERALAQ